MVAVAGEDTSNKDDGHLDFYTTPSGGSNTRRVRIDSSGRIIVTNDSVTNSTGTNTQYASLNVRGNISATSSRAAFINFARSEASDNIANNEGIGEIWFGDQQAGEYGAIKCTADGTAAVGDYPGRLTFHTTADGGTTMTERLRITSGGILCTGNYSGLLDQTAGTIQINGGTSGGRLGFRGTTTSGGGGLGEMHGYWDTNKVASILFHAGSDTSNKDDGRISMYTSASGPSGVERLRIKPDGTVWLPGDNQQLKLGAGSDYSFYHDGTLNHIVCNNNAKLKVSCQEFEVWNYSGTTKRGSWSGDGIKFGSDSAEANALDDYEEGSWTGVAGSAGFSNAACVDEYYIKIGRMVWFGCRLTINSTSNVGDLTITGLPFSTAGVASVAAGHWQDGGSYNFCAARINGSQMERFNFNATPSYGSGTATWRFTGCYRTS
jgi:hypothetical protein